jgi:selenocysteine-specific elongation factor
VIIGTSGHIDHGKTALVLALTGVDTDRLKEEKARGISIELGYAYKPLQEGRVLGFVDVPGHERFIDHMVAGVTGIDFVLLVVAADDGPMPQTVEHLDILELLDVREGAVALTKIDRCEPGRIDQSERETRELLQGTRLAGAPIFRVSSVTGQGIDALGAHLESAAATSRVPRAGSGFRLAVDRSFTLGGFGTVVTGTVFAGEVLVGDELTITPPGLRARVRGIHAQNQPAERGHVGERCALVLAGVAREAVERGDWIVAPNLHAPTERFDARMTLSAREKVPLQQWTSVHLHLGAEHVMARVALLEADRLIPGKQSFVQIVPERPIGALAGDAFILRDASATRTIGGGRVVDPHGPARRRRTPARLETLRHMAELDPVKRLKALVANAAQGVDLNAHRRAFNLQSDAFPLDATVRRVHEGAIDFAFSAAQWQVLRDRLLSSLGEFHAQHSRELGIDVNRLQRTSFPRLDAAVVGALAADLLKDGRIGRSGSAWHLPGHVEALSPDQRRLADGVLPLIEAGGFDPPVVGEITKTLRASESEVRALLLRLAHTGVVYQVVRDHFLGREAIGQLARIVRDIENSSNGVRAAEFRDRIGLGRKRAIEILEFFDRIGYLWRVGDVHRVRGVRQFAFVDEADGQAGAEHI